MNQTKIPWTLLISLLAAVVFGFFCFVSMNFLSLGDFKTSAIKAILITLLLGGLCAGAIILKRTDHNFKICIIVEWVLLFLFIVSSAIFIYNPFTHYFAVSANKEEIQANVNANLDQAENMYAAYKEYADNRLELYEAQLESVCRDKRRNPQRYSEYGFNNTDDNDQINHKKNTLRLRLYPGNFDIMDSTRRATVKEWKAYMDSWKPIGVVDVITTADKSLNEWKEELVGYSEYKAYGEEIESFNYDFTLTDMRAKLQTKAKPTPVSLFYGIGLCLLMLLSYLITGRHPRYPGINVIFNKGKIMSDKEL